MSSLVIAGDVSGSVTLQAPSVAGSTTLTLPATSGTILQSGTLVTEAQGGIGTSTGYYGFKNRIINGAMMIDQRNAGSSVSPVSDSYTLDRWFISGYGSGLNSTSVQQLSATPPAGFTNYLSITNGSSTSTNLFLSQSIETNNCADLAGQTVTLSFWYRIPVSSTNSWTAYLTWSTSANTKVANSGSGSGSGSGNWGSGVNQNTNLANTTTWTKASFTFAVPSNALTVGIAFLNGYNNVVNGAQFQVTGVQLEKGSTATSFDYRDYGRELIMCQRYYIASNYGSSASDDVIFYYINGTNLGGRASFPVAMRSTPTITIYGGTTINAVSNVGGAVVACGTSSVKSITGFGNIQGTAGTFGTLGASFSYRADVEL